MKRVLCVAAVVSCVGVMSCLQKGNTGERRAVPPAVQEGVAERFGDFADAVMSEDYGAIAKMVVKGQAEGFDARAFLEDRMRMKIGSFQVVVWNKKVLAITPIQGRRRYLSQAVAHVRILATNEVRPVYVNLYWESEGGNWCIVPFPGA